MKRFTSQGPRRSWFVSAVQWPFHRHSAGPANRLTRTRSKGESWRQ